MPRLPGRIIPKVGGEASSNLKKQVSKLINMIKSRALETQSQAGVNKTWGGSWAGRERRNSEEKGRGVVVEVRTDDVDVGQVGEAARSGQVGGGGVQVRLVDHLHTPQSGKYKIKRHFLL